MAFPLASLASLAVNLLYRQIRKLACSSRRLYDSPQGSSLMGSLYPAAPRGTRAKTTQFTA